MQALTMAIGPAGIQFFAQQVIAKDMMQVLGKLAPPNADIPIPPFQCCQHPKKKFKDIRIELRSGRLTDFEPVYDSLLQASGGIFPVTLNAFKRFSAHYKWHESYSLSTQWSWRNKWTPFKPMNQSFDYTQGIGRLVTKVMLKLEFNNDSKTYDIKAVESTGEASDVTASIPNGSVILNADRGCFSGEIKDATLKALSSMNFEKPLSEVFSAKVRSIAASGQLANDIYYDFGLGDSGLEFPADNKGIKIGVTGKVRYKTEEYPATPPPPLPLPPPPLDQNHVAVYVSDYEVSALHWAYFRAGLLSVLVKPADLPDPDVLKVRTYVPAIPSFQPFSSFAMWARVEPNKAPVVVFQEVFLFTSDAMAALYKALPGDVYEKILGLEGNGYVAKEDLEGDLAGAEVPQQWYDPIEGITKATGMVSIEDIKFELTIQNNKPPLPNVIFSVARADILTDLGMGISGSAQTMTYKFQKVKSTATFVSSTVPRFDNRNFGEFIWPVAGEPRYGETLRKMGETGVPIPIMSGFQFLFDEAKLRVQERAPGGYVEIVAKVRAKSG